MAMIHIRWTVRRDMPEVFEIEERCYGVGFAWGEEDFIRFLRRRNCIGMVAERNERVVGFFIYELFRGGLTIHNLAVHPKHWRTGVGRVMALKLIDKLSPQRRTRIVVDVRESNMAGQRFFAAMGFEATSVLRGHFEDVHEDAYRMEFVYGGGLQSSRREHMETNQGHKRRG